MSKHGETTSFSEWDSFMYRAIRLASLAEGETSPNPLVGAIVLSNNQIVGESFHERAGMAHAEIGALLQAGDKAKGGTLIVTLEPCCHFGRTPPCTEAIIKSGITRVVIGMKDPDPRVSGSGIAILKSAGIEVFSGVLKEKINYLNRAYIFRVKTGRPWGILKWAMSLDGRIGLTNGLSKWITGNESREIVHKLRAKTDAVIIGGGTLRADNPLLTSRGFKTPEPIRVVLTESLDLPENAQLWDTNIAKSIIAFGPKSDKKKLKKIPDGPEKIELNSTKPVSLLNVLANKGCNSVLWECGPELAAQAINQNCVQELRVFISTKLLGGEPSMTPLGDLGFNTMNEILEMDLFSLQMPGKDLMLEMVLGNH